MANLAINFTTRANTAPLVTSLNQIRAAASGAMTSMRTDAVRVESPLNKLNKQIRNGRLGYRDFGRALSSSNRIIAENNALLQSSATSFVDASGNAKVHLNVLRGVNTTYATFGQRLAFGVTMTRALGKQMIATGKNIQWAGRQVMVGLTLPLLALGVAATKAAEEYDKQLTRIVKVTNLNLVGAVDEFGNFVRTFQLENEKVMKSAIDSIERQADRLVDIGAGMGFMADETGKLVAEFSQMGFAGKALDGLSESALRLSRVSGADLQDSMNLTRLTAMAFGKELGEGPDSLIGTFAKLNLIENQTSLSLAEMAGAIPIVAGVAKNLSIDIDVLGGMLALMKDKGIEAREGATSLRTGLIRLVQDATDPAIEAFNKLGVSITELQEKNRGQVFGLINDLAGILSNLQGETQQAREQTELFIAAIGKMVGTRAAARFTSMLEGIGDTIEQYTEVVNGNEIVQFRFKEGVDETSDAFRALSPAIAESNNAMKQFEYEEKRVNESLAGQAEILRSQLNVELRRFGRLLLPIKNTLMEFVVNLVRSFNNMNASTRRFIGITVGMLAALGPVTMIFGVMNNAIGQMVVLFSRMLPSLKLTTVAAEAERKAFAKNASTITTVNTVKGQAIRTNSAMVQSNNALTASITAQNAALASNIAGVGAAGMARTAGRGVAPASLGGQRILPASTTRATSRRDPQTGRYRGVDPLTGEGTGSFVKAPAVEPISPSAFAEAAAVVGMTAAMTIPAAMRPFARGAGAQLSEAQAMRAAIPREMILGQLPNADVGALQARSRGGTSALEVIRRKAVEDAAFAYEVERSTAASEGRRAVPRHVFAQQYLDQSRVEDAVIRAATESTEGKAALPRSYRQMAGLEARLDQRDSLMLNRQQRDMLRSRHGVNVGRRVEMGALEDMIKQRDPAAEARGATRGSGAAFQTRRELEQMRSRGEIGIRARTMSVEDLLQEDRRLASRQVQSMVDQRQIADTPEARRRAMEQVLPERAKDTPEGRKALQRSMRKESKDTFFGRQQARTPMQKGIAAGRNAMLFPIVKPLQLLGKGLKLTATSLFGIIPAFKALPAVASILIQSLGAIAGAGTGLVAALGTFSKDILGGAARRIGRLGARGLVGAQSMLQTGRDKLGNLIAPQAGTQGAAQARMLRQSRFAAMGATASGFMGRQMGSLRDMGSGLLSRAGGLAGRGAGFMGSALSSAKGVFSADRARALADRAGGAISGENIRRQMRTLPLLAGAGMTGAGRMLGRGGELLGRAGGAARGLADRAGAAISGENIRRQLRTLPLLASAGMSGAGGMLGRAGGAARGLADRAGAAISGENIRRQLRTLPLLANAGMTGLPGAIGRGREAARGLYGRASLAMGNAGISARMALGRAGDFAATLPGMGRGTRVGTTRGSYMENVGVLRKMGQGAMGLPGRMSGAMAGLSSGVTLQRPVEMITRAAGGIRTALVSATGAVVAFGSAVKSASLSTLFSGGMGAVKGAARKAGQVAAAPFGFAQRRLGSIADTLVPSRVAARAGQTGAATPAGRMRLLGQRVAGAPERLAERGRRTGFGQGYSRARDARLAHGMAAGAQGPILPGRASAQASFAGRGTKMRAAASGVRGGLMGMGGMKGAAAQFALGSIGGAAATVAIPIALTLFGAAVANPEAFKSTLSDMMEKPIAMVKGVWDELTGSVRRLVETLKMGKDGSDGLGKTLAQIAGVITGILGTAAATVFGGIATFITTIIELVRAFVQLLQGDTAGAMNTFSTMWLRIKAFVQEALAGILDMISEIPGFGRLKGVADNMRAMAEANQETLATMQEIPNAIADANKARRDAEKLEQSIADEMRESARVIEDLVEFKIIEEGLAERLVDMVTVTADMTAEELAVREENVAKVYDELVGMENITDEQKDQIGFYVMAARLRSQVQANQIEAEELIAVLQEMQQNGERETNNQRIIGLRVATLQAQAQAAIAEGNDQAARSIQSQIAGLQNSANATSSVADIQDLINERVEKNVELNEELAQLATEVSRQTANRAQFSRNNNDALEEEEERLRALEEAAERAKREVQALRGAMGEILGDIDSALKSLIQDQARFVSDYFSNISEQTKNYFDEYEEYLDEQMNLVLENIEITAEAEEDRINDTADLAIQAIEEEQAREEELEKRREEFFRKEKARIDFLEKRRIGDIQIQEEILRGNIAQAAILQIQQRQQAEEFYLSSVEDREAELRQARQKAREEEIAAIEEARLAALANVDIDRQQAQENVFAAREQTRLLAEENRRRAEDEIARATGAAEEARKAEEQRIQNYLREWQRVTPATEEEFLRHVEELERFMTESGTRLAEEINLINDDLRNSMEIISEDFAITNNEIVNHLGETMQDSMFIIDSIVQSIQIGAETALMSALSSVDGFVSGLAGGFLAGEQLALQFLETFEYDLREGFRKARDIAIAVLADVDKWEDAGKKAAEAFQRGLAQGEGSGGSGSGSGSGGSESAGPRPSTESPMELFRRLEREAMIDYDRRRREEREAAEARAEASRAALEEDRRASSAARAGQTITPRTPTTMRFGAISRNPYSAYNRSFPGQAGLERSGRRSDPFARTHPTQEEIRMIAYERMFGNVPQMAKGGVVDKATLAIIGEAGPEAVVPLNKIGQMVSDINAASFNVPSRSVTFGNMNGTNAGNTEYNYELNFNIEGGNIDESKLAQKVVFEIKKMDRNSGAGRRVTV